MQTKKWPTNHRSSSNGYILTPRVHDCLCQHSGWFSIYFIDIYSCFAVCTLAMAYNLKASLVAVTTMVGSAFTFTRTSATGDALNIDKPGIMKKEFETFQHPCSYNGAVEGRKKSQHQETIDQMMLWKYWYKLIVN